MAMNLILIIGSVLALIDNMWVISVGKFLSGFSSSGIMVYGPSYVNEVAPIELKGPFQVMTNSMIAVGMFLPFLFGLAIPDDAKNEVTSFAI